MEKLIFATNNQHKVEEVRLVLGDRFEIVTLKDAGIDIDIDEPHFTLEENASEKSATIYNLTAKNCFSEDTGLEVTALNGAPGVKSARYAGETASFDDNIEKLLKNMQQAVNRQARFRTVISLILNGKEFQFEGICSGKVIQEKRGQEGFGYDPVFIPDGSELTFAEMGKIAKNDFSHRKKAMDKLINFLQDGGDKL
ncbi:non-canonical purine NTP diphosphatase [soil metagenome]